MAGAPRSPEQVVGPFVEQMQGVFGPDLLSIALYGSAARGEYRPGRSDINFFVILSSEPDERLGPLLSFLPRWRKWKVRIPRIVSWDYVQGSLDSFPVEFLSLKLFHRTVYGQDLLGDLSIDKGHLRLQCERELKGKLLHLREGYLLAQRDRSRMERLVAVSLPAFATVFEALLYLKGEQPPSRRRELFERVAESFGLSGQVFSRLLDVRGGHLRLGKEELSNLCREYLGQIRAICQAVDRMD
ncbi:MAG: nucleotidyltransferase domain-containing protein [candidate division KSB1 bacterium]|nr:nucleotidyltransferase domain-containing protein [candidate division KSB1 bacterium]